MPISQYDRFFGGQRGAAEKALSSMKKTYGARDGARVFYARVAKLKRREGVRGRRR